MIIEPMKITETTVRERMMTVNKDAKPERRTGDFFILLLNFKKILSNSSIGSKSF